MMLKFDQLENQNDLSVESQNTQQILNENLNQIIPNILPDSIFYYDFNISNSPLHNQFFE